MRGDKRNDKSDGYKPWGCTHTHTHTHTHTMNFNQWNKYNKAYRELPISAFFAMDKNYARDG